jgi:hypothetical protein
MMARNRKYQAAAVRFGPAMKVLGLCLLLGGSGLGYVWQVEQIHKLGDERKQSERRHERLVRQNEVLSRVLASLQSPSEIELRIKQMNLGLVAPEPDQIVRLVEPAPALEIPDGLRPEMRNGEQPQRLLAFP